MSEVQPAVSPDLAPFDNDAFAEEVFELWGRGGLSRLAELTGYSRGHIGLISRGMRPSVEARRRIEKALEAEADSRAALESTGT